MMLSVICGQLLTGRRTPAVAPRGPCQGVAVLLVVLLSASVQAATQDPEDPRAWLQAMNRAFTELSYDGIFSYFNGSDLTSVRIVHMVIDGEQRERLIHLNGAPREIVRTGETVACILMPGDDLLDLEGNIPSGPFARAFVRKYDTISEHYSLAFFGEDRVAGRLAVRLAITPHDSDRFGYRLWLDQETRLLLKSELIDADGAMLEVFQFNELQLGDAVAADALLPTQREGSVVSHLTLATGTAAPVQLKRTRWQPAWVPEGFVMASADVRMTHDKLKSVNTMMYSDGLAAFSVFIEEMPPVGAASMVSRSGATVAVTHLAGGPESRHQLVTLVGELPTATAQRIAQSIRFE
ncbi:MAG: MucB/RseB C-terminal domain-containing protein [Pseudomonadales bacterium]